ncbi:MAG: EFR1 family ferrodoxin [Firmicutes bacterium]|nr:EFR1 family ferrodoxin [Bacillota bacterium]
MSVAVCYFSGTGNTLWSAKKIAAGLSSAYLVNIGGKDVPNEIVADAAVILFPAYAYGVPTIVRKLIKQTRFTCTYTAILTTYGSKPGGALAEAARLYRRAQGRRPNYMAGIPAQENFLPLFGAVDPKKEPSRRAMQAETTQQALDAIDKYETRKVYRFRPFSSLVSGLFRFARPLLPRFYKVSAERCTGCGICEQVCPVGAAELKDGKAVFNKKCEICMACLNRCPKNAVKFWRLKFDTPRYFHPEEAAEKTGQ